MGQVTTTRKPTDGELNCRKNDIYYNISNDYETTIYIHIYTQYQPAWVLARVWPTRHASK